MKKNLFTFLKFLVFTGIVFIAYVIGEDCGYSKGYNDGMKIKVSKIKPLEEDLEDDFDFYL